MASTNYRDHGVENPAISELYRMPQARNEQRLEARIELLRRENERLRNAIDRSYHDVRRSMTGAGFVANGRAGARLLNRLDEARRKP